MERKLERIEAEVCRYKAELEKREKNEKLQDDRKRRKEMKERH